MSTKILPQQEAAERLARLEILVSAVREMREQQRLFFGGDRSRDRVVAAKRAEKRVDALLADLDAAPAEVQPSLFGRAP